jgi:cytochrome c oxidase accessory protein FixG
MPWLQWNGRQALLFDVTERRFYVLGLVLQPQDFIYLAALLVISALALFFFTAIAGRLWCGYSLPADGLYRDVPVDRAPHRRRPQRPHPARRPALGSGTSSCARAAKQALWVAPRPAHRIHLRRLLLTPSASWRPPCCRRAKSPVALVLGAVLWRWPPTATPAILREQMCKYMCPYARFQSALIDMDSLVIAYDTARGENARVPAPARPTTRRLVWATASTARSACRSARPASTSVNGLQNECIACAACIDVCDGVMDKMGYGQVV